MAPSIFDQNAKVRKYKPNEKVYINPPPELVEPTPPIVETSVRTEYIVKLKMEIKENWLIRLDFERREIGMTARTIEQNAFDSSKSGLVYRNKILQKVVEIRRMTRAKEVFVFTETGIKSDDRNKKKKDQVDKVEELERKEIDTLAPNDLPLKKEVPRVKIDRRDVDSNNNNSSKRRKHADDSSPRRHKKSKKSKKDRRDSD